MNELQNEEAASLPTAATWDIRRKGDMIALAAHGPGDVISVYVLRLDQARDVGTALLYMASGE